MIKEKRGKEVRDRIEDYAFNKNIVNTIKMHAMVFIILSFPVVRSICQQ